MPKSPIDTIDNRVAEAASLYHRLVLVVGPSQSGKTSILRDVARRTGGSYHNLNLMLSERLLELTQRQRVLQTPKLLAELVGGDPATVSGFDNIEVLFDAELRLDPLRLLQSLARQRTIVAAWPGAIRGEDLLYAEPGHAEYRRYSRPEALLVEAGGAG